MSRVFDGVLANHLQLSAEVWPTGATAGTIMVWVKSSNTSPHGLVHYEHHSSGSDMVVINSEHFETNFQVTATAGSMETKVGQLMPQGQWDCCVVRWDDAETPKNILDFGPFQTTGNNAIYGFAASSSPFLRVGAGDAGQPHNGKLAYVAIWTDGLSQTSIDELVGGTNPEEITDGTGSLWDYWSFATSSLVGNFAGNTLTENGTVVFDGTDDPVVDAPPAGGGSALPLIMQQM